MFITIRYHNSIALVYHCVAILYVDCACTEVKAKVCGLRLRPESPPSVAHMPVTHRVALFHCARLEALLMG